MCLSSACSYTLGSRWVTLMEHVKTDTFVLRNLKPATVYLFMVRAANAHGISDPSPISNSVRTQGQCRWNYYTMKQFSKSLDLLPSWCSNRQPFHNTRSGSPSHPEGAGRRAGPPAHAHHRVVFCRQGAVDGKYASVQVKCKPSSSESNAPTSEANKGKAFQGCVSRCTRNRYTNGNIPNISGEAARRDQARAWSF